MAVAPTHPVKTISKLFNLTERRVQQLAKEGIIPKPERGRYDLVGCVQGYIKYLQDVAFGKDASSTDAHAERSRLIRAQADTAELDLSIRRGEHAPIDALQYAIADFSSQARAILDGVVKRVKSSMPDLRAREIKIIEREIIKAKNAASQIQTNFKINRGKN
jgi:phage terminase Nu1 subunit (DNA packaging protein)